VIKLTRFLGVSPILKSKSTIQQTEWAPNHFAWPLVDDGKLSVKLEEIPVAGESDSHLHKRSWQFFFVLDGEADVDIKNQRYQLRKHCGIGVFPNQQHQISNLGSEKLVFLLISSPRVEGDDIFHQ
jgi:mannose-6-phosphate isomerase-like protein (cupin superfamily)